MDEKEGKKKEKLAICVACGRFANAARFDAMGGGGV